MSESCRFSRACVQRGETRQAATGWEWGALQPPPCASREHGGDLTLCSSRAAVLGDTLGDRHNTGVSGTLKTHSKRGRLVGNFSDK